MVITTQLKHECYGRKKKIHYYTTELRTGLALALALALAVAVYNHYKRILVLREADTGRRTKKKKSQKKDKKITIAMVAIITAFIVFIVLSGTTILIMAIRELFFNKPFYKCKTLLNNLYPSK